PVGRRSRLNPKGLHSPPHEGATVRKVLGIALVAGVAVVGRADRAASDPAVDTVLKMKVIAAAMESEAGETDPYPGLPGVFQAVTALRAALAPERRSYLADGKDAWGRP